MTILMILTAKNVKVRIVINWIRASGAEQDVWPISRLLLSKNFVSNLEMSLATLLAPISFEVKNHWNKYFR
jgi:hypothetical protein